MEECARERALIDLVLCSDRMPSSRRGRPAAYRLRAGVYLVGLIAGLVVACDAPLVLTRHVEARRLSSNLQVHFTQAADASNRAELSKHEVTPTR